MSVDPSSASHDGEKYCPRCERWLPATKEHFHRSGREKDGLRLPCKTCRHDEVVTKAANNPNWHKERHQRQRERELAKSSEERSIILARRAETMRKSRARRKQPDLCSICCIRPVEPGKLCDQCRDIQIRWRKNNPERHSDIQRGVRDRRRNRIIEAYGGKCACCGETTPEFLAVDHVNNDGAEHRRHVKNFYAWLVRNNFPQEGFQLLCHNCNFARYFHGVCPHQNTVS